MASISTAGIGSGIDIQSLVGNLIDAERAPVKKRLDKQEVNLQAKISAYGTLKSALSSFQGSLSSLKFANNFDAVTTQSSDEAVVTASGSSIAKPGNYSLEVSNLAQAHSISSSSFTETSSPVGTGSLTFDFGHFDGSAFVGNSSKTSKTVSISSDDNSLQGIRDAVNTAKIGVTASLVNDGSGFKLLFTSDDTGKENGLKISVADTSDASNTDATGLSQLAFDPDPAAAANSHMTENLAAKDAAFTLNGLSITSPSNSVNSAVSGVTLTLKSTTTAGSPVNVSIAKDGSKVSKAVTEFVTKFNELTDSLSQLTSYDSKTKKSGPLLGDSAIRGVESQLRKMISASSRGADGNISSMASIGITTDRSGKLSVNSSKLQSAIKDTPDLVAQIFSAKGSTTDSQVNFVISSKATQTGSYPVNLEVMASRGSLTGSAISSFPLSVTAANDDFSLLVDGAGSGQITLSNKTYASGAELANEIQAKVNASDSLKKNGSSVLVSFADGKLKITSALYGAKSKVEITALEDASIFGLSIGKGSDGSDVKGTIGGQQGLGLGALLTGQGKSSGMVLDFTGGSAGNRGTVFFNRGIADQLDSLIGQFLKPDSLIGARTSGINKSIDRIGQQRTALSNKLSTLEARLYKQFNAMDTVVAQLKSTGSFLDQQLKTLPGVGN